MGLLKEMEFETGYAKIGMLGFQGSGKTFTATEMAVGICRLIKELEDNSGDEKIGKPFKGSVAMMDTETGSDFMVKRITEAGLKFPRFKGRAFADLLTVIREAEQTADILIIDSITHIWNDLMESYKRKKGVKTLAMHHWGPIKTEWSRFADLFVNSKLHIIMCGRAGWTYETEDRDDGGYDLKKTGTRMKAEADMGYEPSLLIEMTRERETSDPGAKIIHVAHVIKDRTNLMDGVRIVNPTFESFNPIWKYLNLNRTHHGVDTTRTSEGMFDKGGGSFSEELRARQVGIEELAGLVTQYMPGRSTAEILIKSTLYKVVLGTVSAKALEDFRSDVLRKAFPAFKFILDRVRTADELPKDGVELEEWMIMQYADYTDRLAPEPTDELPMGE